MTSQLQLDAALHSVAGRKPFNEDCAGVRIPEDAYSLVAKGAVMVVADGVSTAEAGKEASEMAVGRFVEEYFHTPEPWSVAHAGEKVISAMNLRLYRRSHEYPQDNKGYLCTFSAVVIKGRTAHYFHVGDSRIYLLRAGQMKQVTEDHVAQLGDGKFFLSRAIGMDSHLHIDYGRLPLEQGDRLLMSSDGLHEFIPADRLATELGRDASSAAIAETLVNLALENKSDDNVSGVVVQVLSLPSESLDDYSARLTRLPFPPPLEPGMKIDGFRVESEMFASSRSQIYCVSDEETGERYVMKTPSRNYEDDMSYIDRFIQEEWIGCRIVHPNVVRVIRPKRHRSALYYLMEYVQGTGLDQWMKANRLPKPKRAIAIVRQIAEGLEAFHGNEAIHQDLKPANVMIDADDRVKIVDFGAVHVAGIAEQARPVEHLGALGTASYSDPLYLLGKNPGIQGDLYALATITYEMFTGELPYGEKVEECRSVFDYDQLRYRSATLFNPIIPVWFDRALARGTAFDVQERYTTIAAFMTDLTAPNPEYLRDDPKIEKSGGTLMFWKLVSGFWFVTFLLVIYLFSRSS